MIRSLSFFLALSGQAADPVDALIERTMTAQKIPGLTLVVKQNGKVVKEKAYGLADIAGKKPTSMDSVFETGSIGKSFTAVLVMQLVGEKKIGLDDPVSKYIPEAPDKWKAVTIRHMLTHQSGMPDYALMPGVGLIDTYTRKQFFDAVVAAPMDFETGRMFQYSNTNYAILGYVAEMATGIPYGQLVTDRVLKRAGMTKSLFLHDASPVPNMALGYMLDQAQVPQTGPKTTTSGSGADGSFASTSGDLIKFADALNGGKLLPKRVVAEMQLGAPTTSGRKAGYGLGFFVRKIGDKRFISHGGNSVGYSASISMFPDSGLTIGLMCNLYPVGGDNLARSIAEIYDPSLVTVGLKEQADPHPKLTDWLLDGLKALAKGEFDDKSIDPDLRSQLRTGRGAMMRPGFNVFNTIERLSYVRTEPDGDDSVIRYRGFVGERKFAVVVSVGKDHRIFAASARPE